MQKIVYEIMHKNRKAAQIDTAGHCRIYFKSFMPYNLYLEENDDLDSLVNNITNFNYWCASRVLTLDRKYAKEILNSIGMPQATTDRERAKIVLSYRCASLTDSKYILKLDAHNYYMMNIIDYLVGNTDRHWGNWGVLVDNSNNTAICLHKLMDFNQAFHAYDTLEGANCQTAFGLHITQKEAALQAVKKTGLNQISEVGKEIFTSLPQYYEMFIQRLKLLQLKSKNI